MTKSQQTATKPVIVLFFHPGRECPVGRWQPDAVVPVAWVREKANASCTRASNEKLICNGHTRRLIVHAGQYIDESGKRRNAQLAFWGEWEAPTLAKAMPKAPRNESDSFARWFHTVQLPLGVRERNLSNTDPCVFGSTFKYCCCQQHGENETNTRWLRNLPPGSLILFGSKVSGKFALDTVFVVGKVRIPYMATGDYHELGGSVSENYKELTLNRLTKKEENAFYRGQVYQRSEGLYSFSPARLFRQGDYRCGQRFVLDFKTLNELVSSSDDEWIVNPKQHRGVKYIEPKDRDVSAVWSDIVRLVYDAEFVPGVHFGWPESEQPNGARSPNGEQKCGSRKRNAGLPKKG